jgi:hypothetical protein
LSRGYGRDRWLRTRSPVLWLRARFGVSRFVRKPASHAWRDPRGTLVHPPPKTWGYCCPPLHPHEEEHGQHGYRDHDCENDFEDHGQDSPTESCPPIDADLSTSPHISHRSWPPRRTRRGRLWRSRHSRQTRSETGAGQGRRHVSSGGTSQRAGTSQRTSASQRRRRPDRRIVGPDRRRRQVSYRVGRPLRCGNPP